VLKSQTIIPKGSLLEQVQKGTRMWANVMEALPNIGGALCSMPQSLTDAHY